MENHPSKKPHLVFIKQTFRLRGGLEKYCLALAKWFSRKGYAITILTSSSIDDLQGKYQGVEFVRLRVASFRLSFLKLALFDYKVRQWAKKEPEAILFGFDRHFIPLHYYRAGNGCHKAYLKRRIAEGGWLQYIKLMLNPLHWCTIFSEKRTFENERTQVICNSALVEQEILTYYPRSHSENIHVIHNGVDWMGCQSAFEMAYIDRGACRTAWNVPQDAVHIVLVGHEWYRKGVDILLKAIPIVRDALPNIPLYVTIAGRERHPERFLQISAELGLTSSDIQFIPSPVSSIELFQSADIAVIPSRYDPFANVTVEALAMGLWVVTSVENGGGEAIYSGTGHVAQELTPQAIAAGIIEGVRKLLALEVTKVSIRNEARRFDFNTTLDQYVDLIESNVDIHRRGR